MNPYGCACACLTGYTGTWVCSSNQQTMARNLTWFTWRAQYHKLCHPCSSSWTGTVIRADIDWHECSVYLKPLTHTSGYTVNNIVMVFIYGRTSRTCLGNHHIASVLTISFSQQAHGSILVEIESIPMIKLPLLGLGWIVVSQVRATSLTFYRYHDLYICWPVPWWFHHSTMTAFAVNAFVPKSLAIKNMWVGVMSVWQSIVPF